VTVKCLLIYPNPESALDEEAGKLLLEEYASYCERAKLITSVHATPRVKPVEFNATCAAAAAAAVNDSSSSTSTKEGGGSCPASASGLVATAVKVDGPTTATTLLPIRPLISITSPKSTNATTPLIITRKSASPLPKNPLSEKEGGVQQNQQQPPHKAARHPSPSPLPLGTADSNVGRPGMGGGGKGMAQSAGGGVTGTKAMKRAATGSVPTNAEKRKKALKRL